MVKWAVLLTALALTGPCRAQEGAEDLAGVGVPAPDAKKVEFKITTIEESPDCQDRVKSGDIVSIRHSGFAGERQIDADGGEPLTIQVGVGRLLLGMEKGLIGQCVGETRVVDIPPEMGFYEPGRNFGDRVPVPNGVLVTYQMKVISIQPRPGTLSYLMSAVQSTLSDNMGTILFVGIASVFFFYLNSGSGAKSAKKRGSNPSKAIKRALSKQKSGKK